MNNETCINLTTNNLLHTKTKEKNYINILKMKKRTKQSIHLSKGD